jgi:hypothetical protein
MTGFEKIISWRAAQQLLRQGNQERRSIFEEESGFWYGIILDSQDRTLYYLKRRQ